MARDRLAARRKAMGFTQESLAHVLGVERTTVGRWERGESDPQPDHRQPLADKLDVRLTELDDLLALPDTSAVALADDWTTVTPPDPGDVEALELIRRVEASDVGPATLTALAQATDLLARAYTSTSPVELLVSLRAYRGFVLRLLDGRVTLAQRRELIVIAGWLSLLLATCEIDLNRYRSAGVNLRAARTMAHEADHSLLTAWIYETGAWHALTEGRPDEAIVLCRAAHGHVADGTSVHVQISMQEARSSARLGLVLETHRLLEESATSLDRMPAPEHPEHHYTFDRRKHISYSATTLAWLGDNDDEAEQFARQAVEQYDTGATDGRWKLRLGLARLDLALILARRGEHGEAAHLGALALDSGALRQSNLWRAAELGQHLADSRDPVVAAYRDRLASLPSETL